MTYDIMQGKILTKLTPERTCNVMQIPDHYIVRDVRLPRTLMSQSLPQSGSIVLFAVEGSHKAFIISVLREPLDFINKPGVQGLRASSDLDAQQLQPGEIFLESRGDPSAPFPGLGATFFMGNDGTIALHSGKRKECLILGGTDDDDDGEVILQGDNGFFESTINENTFVQSTYRFDENNNLALGNILTDGGVTNLEIPICELTMDTLGNTKLRNTIFGTGTDNASVEFTAAGTTTLRNTLGSLVINAVGQITIDGPTISLNNGTLGAARLTDVTTSDLTSDPAWWLFWSTIATTIAALPTTPLDGGATLKAGLAALFGTIPQTILGKITTASTTVRIGG